MDDAQVTRVDTMRTAGGIDPLPCRIGGRAGKLKS